MIRMEEIRTPRLRLLLMPISFLQASLACDVAAAQAVLNVRIPRLWFKQSELIAMRLIDCDSDPQFAPWSLRAICDSARTMVGYIGFHARPGAAYLQEFAPSGVEFGYRIFPRYQGLGYATEAARGIILWAAAEHRVRRFALSIAPGNLTSQRVATKLGFVKIGNHLDQADGFEEVHCLDGTALDHLLACAEA